LFRLVWRLLGGLFRRLLRGFGRCGGHRLDEAAGYRRLDGGRRGTDELAHILQFGKDNLALDSELSC